MVSSYSLSCNTVHTKTAVPEIIDFGYPQNSEIDTLKTYITTESIMSSASAVVSIVSRYQVVLEDLIVPLGGIIKDHHTSDRCHKLASCGCKIQEE